MLSCTSHLMSSESGLIMVDTFLFEGNNGFCFTPIVVVT